jgi:hypothetical protein
VAIADMQGIAGLLSFVCIRPWSERGEQKMASTPLFTCVCGVQRKTSNHWILATCTPGDLRFAPWDDQLARRDDVIVLCGEGCAAALLSRSLGEWKQQPVAGAPRALEIVAA